MIQSFLKKLDKRENLLPNEMMEAMEAIISGRLTDDDIEAFLRKLSDKGETAVEVSAAASIMRRHAKKLSKSYPDLLDTCGTGGDFKNTFNVSTVSAIVAASAGVQVAKHGNRSVTSACGSADLLELLGIKIDLTAAGVESCLDKTGFGFFFAPNFHPATRFAMPARKRIKGKTIFNLLGPLSNPAGARHQLVGVYAENKVELVAEALRDLGSTRALVVHGMDGLDEITLMGETIMAELQNGKIVRRTFKPEDAGMGRSALTEIVCGSKKEAHDLALSVLEGQKSAATDIVCLNSGAALCVAGKCASIQEGVRLAIEVLEDGLALEKCQEIAEFSQTCH